MGEKKAACTIALAALLIGLTGCSATVTVHQTGADTVMICISSLDRGAGGASSDLPVGTRPPPATGPEQDPQLRAPEAGAPPPVGTSPQPQNAPAAPTSAREATSELQGRYGIRVTGNPTDRSIDHLIYAARQVHPQDTQGLTFDFVDYGAGATLGQWAWNGRVGVVTIFGPAKESVSTIYHELLHHVTNGRPSNIGYGVARRVSQQLGGMNPRAYPMSVITGPYAQTGIAEFWAELFSAYRIRPDGRDRGDRFSMIQPRFDPPAALEPTINGLYADGGVTP